MLRLRSRAVHGVLTTAASALRQQHRFVSDQPESSASGLVSWTHCIPVRLSRVRSPKRGPDTNATLVCEDDILLLPMLHAGSPAYYDFVLDQVSTFLCDGETTLHATPEGNRPVEENRRVLIEGVSVSEDEARMQKAEWNAITEDTKLQQYLEEAATKHVKEAAARSAEFLSTFNDFCRDFRLKPESIPNGVVLEDFYFKPLLASRFSRLLTNPDLILRAASVPRQLLALASAEAPFGSTSWLLRPEVSAYRERLFLSDLIHFFEEGSPIAPSDGSVSKKKAIGLWGNAHVTHLTRFLAEDHGFNASKCIEGFPFGWDPQASSKL
jgi:hypothetical protein